MDAPTSRHDAYVSLWRRLRPLPDLERQQLIETIMEWAGIANRSRIVGNEPLGWPRRLSPDEIITLGTGGLIEIGAHTVTHPFLPALAPALQEAEIQHSRVTLTRILGQSPASFAYPYGSYGDETVTIVQKAGFATACSAHPGRIDPSADLFRLPRVAVPDSDGDEFARQLVKWMGG